MTEAAVTQKRSSPGKRFKNWLLAKLAMALFINLMRTIRYRVEGAHFRDEAKKKHPKGSHIIAIWHENSFATVSGHRNQSLVPMISMSNDGEMIARICIRLGYKPPVRGSSSRGGRGVKEAMVKAIQGGASGAITVDGPRGPRRQVKFGVIKIASDTGAPIVPSSGKVSRMWVFRSWDRFRLPKPFSKVTVTYGKPVYVPPNIDKSQMQKYADELADNLNALEEGQ
jgi:hypothetical protein